MLNKTYHFNTIYQVSINISGSETIKAFLWGIVTWWFIFSGNDNKERQSLFSHEEPLTVWSEISVRVTWVPLTLEVKCLLSLPVTTGQPQTCEQFTPNQTSDFWVRKKPRMLHAFSSPQSSWSCLRTSEMRLSDQSHTTSGPSALYHHLKCMVIPLFLIF